MLTRFRAAHICRMGQRVIAVHVTVPSGDLCHRLTDGHPNLPDTGSEVLNRHSCAKVSLLSPASVISCSGRSEILNLGAGIREGGDSSLVLGGCLFVCLFFLLSFAAYQLA